MDSDDKLLATVMVVMFVGVVGSMTVGWPAMLAVTIILGIIHFPKKVP